MSKKFKPMLGKEAPENKEELNFPVIASFKLDGIRAIFHPELGLVSRSLKPIKNKQLNKQWEHLIYISKKQNVIFDGEFYHHELTFQQITSCVMTEDFNEEKQIKKLIKAESELLDHYSCVTDEGEYVDFYNPVKFHCFDVVENMEFDKPFDERLEIAFKRFNGIEPYLMQRVVETPEELNIFFELALKNDYEGLIVRKPNGHYKFGRSTEKEALLLKYKPFVTYDAEIVGCTERFKNTNESFKNELGQSTKRNTVDDKEPTGLASAFIVKWNDTELKVSLPGTEEFRKEIWDNRQSYIGGMIEFKGMDVGSKDVPRHPVFVRFRNDRK